MNRIKQRALQQLCGLWHLPFRGKKETKHALFLVVSVHALVFSLAGFGSVHAQDAYHGIVIDRETKEPIEGAVVLAIWRQRAPGVAHPRITYHDAQETLTDQQGNFTIPGIVGVPTVAHEEIGEPQFTIFKPGYEAYGGWSMRAKSFPGTIRLYEKDGRTVVELGRLKTRDERLRNLDKVFSFSRCLSKEASERLKLPALSPGSAYCLPKEKIHNLIGVVNIERVSLGLEPYPQGKKQ